jgi:hypothetical protein
MKLDLLTNATVVDDAIRFVSSNQSKEKSLANSNEGEKEESKEPDYDEDEDQLEEEAKDNIKRYIDERLPEEYEKCLVGLNAITREAWNTADNTEDKREKIHALSLAKECYSMKLELLTNATVVDDAIRFISDKSEERVESTDSSNEDEKESKEPDYDEDEDQLEEEQEEVTRTINEVF